MDKSKQHKAKQLRGEIVGLIVIIGIFIAIVWFVIYLINGVPDTTNRKCEDSSWCLANKRNTCTNLCAGEDSTPYLKSQCRTYCYQIWYYGGEEALDKQIEEYEND